MLTLLVFLVILGILVFVHELGHFVVARRNGIKADEFGFGFPPRAIGCYLDEKTNKWKIVKGSEEIVSKNTIYSLNWFPIGGFVKIKGEDGGSKKEADSFTSKSAWIRIKVLAAGVTMNLLLAWVLLSATFMIGSYQDVTGENTAGSKILIEGIEQNSPAEKMGLKIGDTVSQNGEGATFATVEQFQKYIAENRGKEVTLVVQRGNQQLSLTGTPRTEIEAGKGALGISSLGEVITKKYSFIQSFWEGLKEMGNMLMMIGQVFYGLFHGQNAGVEVMGPVKLAIFTGQIIPLGFVFMLRFVAIFSVNLAIVNILPFPALDGGRILFILIEKMKGSPVSQKVETVFHSVGMLILLSLMFFITVREIFSPEILSKIKGFF
ncbi:MAG: RIP metalloprotease RseP [Candidatus Moranbacteria bacterium]|nr:RIP metalloprotease RseP [Candidatus Moranbacteria bacterium]